MITRISGNVCNKYVHIDLIIEEVTASAETNMSMIKWQLVGYLGAGASNSYWYSNSYHTINVKIDGETVYSLPNTTQSLISIGTDATQKNPTVIATGMVRVPHDNDGSKVCSASFSVAYRYSSSFKWSGAADVELAEIARASRLTTGEGSTFDFGGNLVFNTNRASTAFTHKLYYSVAGNDKVLIAEGIEDSYTWLVPLELMNHFPDARRGEFTFTLETYKDNKYIGNHILSGMYILIPSNIVPTIDAIMVDDATRLMYKYGLYVQGYSKLNVYVDATGAYSSTIKSYTIDVDGVQYLTNDITTDVIKTTEVTITATVTDSRGRTATLTQTRPLLPYTSPTISELKASRCNEDGTENDEGAYMQVKLVASIDPLKYGGVSANSKQFILEYKAAADEVWTTRINYTNAYRFSASPIIAADVDSTYSVRLTVIDDFNTVTQTVELPTGYTLMDFNESGKGIAFGKVSEQDAFECAIDAIFKSCTTEAGADLDALAADVAAIKAQLGIE